MRRKKTYDFLFLHPIQSQFQESILFENFGEQ